MKCFIQDLSLNVHSYLDFFPDGSSSLFDNQWLYQQRYHELVVRKSASFIWCIRACMNLNGTEWLVEMDWKNFEKDQKSFGTFLKIWQKNACGKAAFLESWWSSFRVNLHTPPYFWSLRQTLPSPRQVICLSQTEQLPKLPPPHLDMLTIALVCIFS